MKRVIIADDSRTARMFIRRCLEIAGLRGAEFVEVGSGEEALAALSAGGGDLLFTDFTMPGIDGAELVRRVKADPKWKGLVIIVITSAKSPAKDAELMSLGAAAVLGKPVAPPAIAQVLKQLSITEAAS